METGKVDLGFKTRLLGLKTSTLRNGGSKTGDSETIPETIMASNGKAMFWCRVH